MTTVTRFVGLDYHQDSIQVCVMNQEGEILVNRKTGNDAQKVENIIRETALQDSKEVAVTAKISIEACTGAANLSEELMLNTGRDVRLAHPGIVNRMKQNPDKSDKTDAYILADLIRIGYLPKVWLAPKEIRQLRTLVRYRAQKRKERTKTKLRLRSILREVRKKAPVGVNAWTIPWMNWLRTLELDEVNTFVRDEHLEDLERLNQKIKDVEKQLRFITKDDVVMKKLMSLEGIGFITAVTMRAEIARFDRFNSGKQLSRYCGVTPRNASSGTRQADAGLVQAGNSELRIVLIQAAQRLVNSSDTWREFVERLRAKGKPRNVIVAAVANRWLRRLYHEMQPEQLAVIN